MTVRSFLLPGDASDPLAWLVRAKSMATTKRPLSIRVGRLTGDEYPIAFSVDKKAHEPLQVPALEWTYLRFARQIGDRRVVALKAMLRGPEQLLGSLLVGVDGAEATILRLGVHPEYHRRGIGRQLVEAIPEHCSPEVRTIMTHVHEDNMNGCLFLRSCGFRATKLYRQSAGDGRDSILMSRAIG